MVSAPDRPGRRPARRAVVTSVLIVAAYYLAPIEPGVSKAQIAVRAAATVAVGLLVTWQIVRQISHQINEPDSASLVGLLLAIVGGATFFALVDFITARSGHGQFTGIETKTDALYFALTTLTTVGYGDIHATGQAGRVVVMVQLVFNVAIIATSASLLTRQLGARVRARARRAEPPPGEHPQADG
jgi:voltage-gated potassium channel